MAAGWVRARSESAEAMADLQARFRLQASHWPWIAGVILFPIILYVAGARIALATGRDVVEPFAARSTEFPTLRFPVYALVSLAFYGFGEEVGWRGWWLPKLRSIYSPRHSALIQGLAWVLWHVPLFFLTPGYRAMDGWTIVGWTLSTFASAALFVWLFKFTRGSVVVAAFFHAMMDIAFLASPHPVVSQVLGGLITVLAVIALLLLPTKTEGAPRRAKGS
jgi:membrane protease YdiL (CAAX protease family)